jgi:hypothetical protein
MRLRLSDTDRRFLAGEHGEAGRMAMRILLFAEEFLADVLHLRDACAAADHQHFVDLACLEPGFGQRLLGGADEAVEQFARELLKLRAGDGQLQVLRA